MPSLGNLGLLACTASCEVACVATDLSPEQNSRARGAPCAQVTAAQCMDADTQKMRVVVSPGKGDLVISEVMAAPAAVSETDGEWFELYARKNVDLNGLLVRAGNSKAILSSTSCIGALANTYSLFARNGDSAMNGGLPPLTAESSVSLPDNASSLSIANGNTVIDQIAWTSPKKGVAWQIAPSALDASPEERASVSLDSAVWCATPAGSTFGSGDRGTPGAPNLACPAV